MPKRKGGRVGKVSVESLFPGRVSHKVALAGMADLERELDKRFKERRAEQARKERLLRKIHAPILRLVENDEQIGEAVRQLRAEAARAAKAKLAVPKVAKVAPRIFPGSIGVTFAPAYDYDWTWTATAGYPYYHSATADRTAGSMSFNLSTSDANAAAASGRAAIGAFYQPPGDNGVLRIFSTPSFNYTWGTYCVFASAHSDGFIGLYVGQYTLAGGFDGAPVSQMTSLWSDDSWVTGAHNSASNSGYGLWAQLNVDSSHYYLIWVWCGGHVSAGGWGGTFTSTAVAQMSAAVPSIYAEFSC